MQNVDFGFLNFYDFIIWRLSVREELTSLNLA